MIRLKSRRFLGLALAAALLLAGRVTPAAGAEELVAETKSEPAQPAETPANQTQTDAAKDKAAAPGGSSAAGQRFDPAVVSMGMAAFERSCTKCHDAARSLERTHDIAGWRGVVRRMAGKRGAEIAQSDMEPIAVYLASRNATAAGPATDGSASAAAGNGGAAAGNDASSLSAFATLSPLWRGGNNHVQNPDFGPLAWVGASWQGKVVSARATLCTTCHGVSEPGLISRVEVVEAAVRVDLSQYVDSCWHGLKAAIDAGRFVVPFGAFSEQVNPGLYRTVSQPLIFNMGQRVFASDIGYPVLPMPFANQGVDFNLAVPLWEWAGGPITATGDGYVINGLVGSSTGVDFLHSRDMFDNNDRVAGGGRVTIGGPNVRAGASLTGGRLDDPNITGLPGGLYYRIFGFDLQAHYKRLIRCQFEYARRDSDRFGTLPGGDTIFNETVSGCYAEAELRPGECCRVSFLTRYDFQRTNSPLPPPGGTLPAGPFDVQRVTFGLNFDLWHQSLLMLNYERWILPVLAHHHSDVFGVRYAITF